MHTLRTLGLLFLAGCAYEAPDDPAAEVAPAVISGTLLVSGADEAATTMVLIYDAADPPPPVGTGSPLTFATVPATRFRGAGDGLLEAPFEIALPGIQGDVLVTALADQDEDFYPLPPLSSVLGGATCGDLSGAHVADLSTGELQAVTVATGVESRGISVVVARESLLERPAFVMQGGSPTMSREAAAAGTTQTFRMASTGVAAVLPGEDGVTPLLDLADPFDGSDPCGTSFWLTVYDRDGDGQPDEHPDLPGTGLPDAWPRVILQYLGEIDESGVVVTAPAEGESWVAQAALLPDVVWFGEVPLNVPTPVTEVEYVWLPVARHTLDGTTETVQDPSALPAGAWSVTLISVAGQTWTLPNALAGVGTSDESRFVPASQAGALLVE